MLLFLVLVVYQLGKTTLIVTGQTYKFLNVNYCTFLSGRKECNIVMSNTYELIELDGNYIGTADEEEVEELQKARIIGCQKPHHSYILCGKLLDDGNSTSARCSKCNVLQQIKDCDFEVAATVLIKSDDAQKIMLKICTKNILKLFHDFDVSQLSKTYLIHHQ